MCEGMLGQPKFSPDAVPRFTNVHRWYIEPVHVLTAVESKRFTGTCSDIRSTVSCFIGLLNRRPVAAIAAAS
jgi:hypothetical protein